MTFTDTFWPWWMGSIALALIAISYYLVNRRLLGVSGVIERVIFWKQEHEREKIEALTPDNQQDFEAILLEATIKEFGEEINQDEIENIKTEDTTEQHNPTFHRLKGIPVSAYLIFIIMIIIGGMISALLQGTFQIHTDLGKEFVQIMGSGWHSWLVLFIGGIMIGLGTRLSGGCTTGHGLIGCSRFQLGSILATISFFGSAILISLLLKMFV